MYKYIMYFYAFLGNINDLVIAKRDNRKQATRDWRFFIPQSYRHGKGWSQRTFLERENGIISLTESLMQGIQWCITGKQIRYKTSTPEKNPKGYLLNTPPMPCARRILCPRLKSTLRSMMIFGFWKYDSAQTIYINNYSNTSRRSHHSL